MLSKVFRRKKLIITDLVLGDFVTLPLLLLIIFLRRLILNFIRIVSGCWGSLSWGGSWWTILRFQKVLNSAVGILHVSVGVEIVHEGVLVPVRLPEFRSRWLCLAWSVVIVGKLARQHVVLQGVRQIITIAVSESFQNKNITKVHSFEYWSKSIIFPWGIRRKFKMFDNRYLSLFLYTNILTLPEVEITGKVNVLKHFHVSVEKNKQKRIWKVESSLVHGLKDLDVRRESLLLTVPSGEDLFEGKLVLSKKIGTLQLYINIHQSPQFIQFVSTIPYINFKHFRVHRSSNLFLWAKYSCILIRILSTNLAQRQLIIYFNLCHQIIHKNVLLLAS